MRDGISGTPVPSAFPFSGIFNTLGAEYNVAPCLLAAIKMNETGLNADPNELEDGADPNTGLLPNGDPAGHGLMQLTSSWPSDWNDATANIRWAITKYVIPAWDYWHGSLQGDDLARAIFASYNAGIGGAQRGHDEEGDVDAFTTDHYAGRALPRMQALDKGEIPE